MSFTFTLDVAAPYPGLRPFLRDESVIFFGRDQQIDDVLARLKTHRFLGVVGTSGCGKSSLVRAGMLPALESGLMGELGSTWLVADMKPGDAPLTNLAKALINSGVLAQRSSDTPEGIALLTAALRRSDVSLVNLIRQLKLPPFTNLLVLADQFEEIFRFQQQDPNEALAFVNLLLETSRDRSVPIFIVMTMRTDFLGQCALFPGLPESLNDSQYLCPRMSRDQLTEAIKGPAEVFGATVEPALVTQLLNDAGANSDQLPLVQHVLARIWRIWHGCPKDGHGPAPEASETVLRLKNYQDRGGLIGFSAASSATPGVTAGIGVRDSRSGMGPGYSYRQNALSEHADEAYLELGDSQPESRIGGPDHNPSHKQVIAQMLLRCLAERGQSQASGEHESAGSWLEIEEQSRRRYRRLVEAAENEPTAGLLRNPELEFLNLWWKDFRPSPAWANACVKESFDRTQSFLKRSLAQAAADKAAAEAEQRERLVAAEATARTMTRRSILISVVALAVVGLAFVVWRAQVRANQGEQEALKQQGLADQASKEAATQAKLATE